MSGHFEKGVWVEDPPRGCGLGITGERIERGQLVCMDADGQVRPGMSRKEMA